MLTTKALPCGSFKAAPSQIGKPLDHYCGSTENVLLSPSAASLLLTDFYLPSRFWKECAQVRLFRPRLIMAFSIDDPIARPLSRILSPSATQDLLISPISSSISRTSESRMSVAYFPLSSFNSATNPHLFATFSLPTIHPTNLAPNNPVTAHSYNVSKTCSKHQHPSQCFSLLMPWTNVPTQPSFRRHAKRCWSLSRRSSS